MRHGTQGRRPRNKGHNGGGSNHSSHNNNGGARRGTYNRNQIFDSNGPDVRIRGTAHQVCEKYLALAKDATSVGDIVLAESYLQHAEHYQRIINTWVDEFQSAPRPNEAYAPQPQQQQMRNNEDDLALPISILGPEVKATNEGDVRQPAYQPSEMLETA